MAIDEVTRLCVGGPLDGQRRAVPYHVQRHGEYVRVDVEDARGLARVTEARNVPETFRAELYRLMVIPVRLPNQFDQETYVRFLAHESVDMAEALYMLLRNYSPLTRD